MDWLVRLPPSAVNPVLYVVVPGLVLAALGTSPRDTGWRRGHHSWRVVLLWAWLPLGQIAGRVVGHHLSPVDLILGILRHTFQDGLSEEWLFRGALQTRIARLAGTPWAVVASSLAFGFWHMGSNIHRSGIPAGLGLCVVDNAVVGLGYAVVFVRTRSLLASSVIHVVRNL